MWICIAPRREFQETRQKTKRFLLIYETTSVWARIKYCVQAWSAQRKKSHKSVLERHRGQQQREHRDYVSCLTEKDWDTCVDVQKFFFSQRVVKESKLLSQEVVHASSVNQYKNRLDKFWQRYGH